MQAQAQQIERLARDLHALAFDMAEPSRTTARSDRIIAEGERIAIAVWTTMRGKAGGAPPAMMSR